MSEIRVHMVHWIRVTCLSVIYTILFRIECRDHLIDCWFGLNNGWTETEIMLEKKLTQVCFSSFPRQFYFEMNKTLFNSNRSFIITHSLPNAEPMVQSSMGKGEKIVKLNSHIITSNVIAVFRRTKKQQNKTKQNVSVGRSLSSKWYWMHWMPYRYKA